LDLRQDSPEFFTAHGGILFFCLLRYFRRESSGRCFFDGNLGIFTIILGYYLGRKINGEFLGFSLASVIAVSPLMVSLAVQIWNPNIAPLFVVCTLLILYKIYLEKSVKLRYFFVLGILLALIPDLEIVFGLIFFIGIILSLLISARKKISLKIRSCIYCWRLGNFFSQNYF